MSAMIAWYGINHIGLWVEPEPEDKPNYYNLPDAFARMQWVMKYWDPPDEDIME